MGKARRVTIYKARDGWRYRVQGGNWRIIGQSKEGKVSLSRVKLTTRKLYPGVEEVVEYL